MINVNVINDKCIRVYTVRRIKQSNSFISCVFFYGFVNTICKPDFNNLQQVCHSQFAASLQFTTCSKSAVHNLQQVCSSQLAASLQQTYCHLCVSSCVFMRLIEQNLNMFTPLSPCSKKQQNVLFFCKASWYF